MRRQPKRIIRKFSKGQVDHVDAWLMSYADMITLLFIVVVIAIPVTMRQHTLVEAEQRGEPEHPYHISDHSGLLAVNTNFDEAYRSLVGDVIRHSADESISIEKGKNSMWLDIALPYIFEGETADIRLDQVEFLKSLVQTIKIATPEKASITIEGYTDDKPLFDSIYANKWELSSMQTARIAGLLVQNGIDSSRLQIASYTDNAPIVPNFDDFGKPINKNRERNQRIVIRLQMPPTVIETLGAEQ